MTSKRASLEGLLKEMCDGYRKVNLIRAALNLGIFEFLHTPRRAEDLASETGANARIIRLMLECLSSMDLVEKRGDRYALSELSSSFLIENSPYSLTTYLKKLFSDLKRWERLEEIATNGPERVERERFFPEVIHSMAQHALLGELQRTVEAVRNFEEFKNAKKLLDLGGGHGLYAIAFTKINPELKAIVFDLPEVIEEARKYLDKYGGERVELVAGDFFRDDIGRDYDVIFSSYNPSGKNPAMIEKIWRALKSGGIFVNKQYFWGDNAKEIELEDLEWNLWRFEEVEKGEKRYTFKNDLSLEEYIERLKEKFEILDVTDFGRAKMVVARKTK